MVTEPAPISSGLTQALSWRRLRVTLVAALLFGLFMLLTRGTVGGPLQHFALAMNALLILVFAGLAWRNALEIGRASCRERV